MKSYILIVIFVGLSAAATTIQRTRKEQDEVAPIPIVNQEYDSGFDGTFTNKFETGNGIAFEQSGNVKTVLGEDKKDIPVQEIVGSYSYTAPDGTPVKVEYIANEKGFQPQGEVLPTPPPNPPLPLAIARAIKFIEEHPEKKE